MHKKVSLIFFDAGGGHRSAANALTEVIEQQKRPWEISLLNLQELLSEIDPLRKFSGLPMQDAYNAMLEHGWTLGSAQLLRVLQFVIRLYHRPVVRVLEHYWQETQPDMVISVIPHFNRAIAESVWHRLPSIPFVTIVTDLADYPPHFWIEHESNYIVCGTHTAVLQARALGHGPDRVFRASGMILNPKFYESVDVDRASGRQRLGLDPERPTGMVMFGGCGAAVMREIVERLDAVDLDVQLILICGHNQELTRTLRNLRTRMRTYVEGFTRNMPYYMSLADFFIGKTGPASISEAVAMQLPVIVERNARTLPQERYNASWILENGVGIVLNNFSEIVSAVQRLAEPPVLATYRSNAIAIANRAVFEIPEFLEEIFERSARGENCRANAAQHRCNGHENLHAQNPTLEVLGQGWG